MNRAQLIEFIKRSLAHSQACSLDLAQATVLLANCTNSMLSECESMSNKVIEMFGEIDDQDRELDALYGLGRDEDE